MRTRTVGALGALAAASALATVPGAATARTLHIRGAVVHHNARAHSFVVATSSGRLYAVHGRAPTIGRTVTLTATPLLDGTLRLRHAAVLGLRRHVRIRGVVTYVNRRAGLLTVSAPGVSMLVVTPRHAARASDATPSVGTEVVATGVVDDQGELDEQSIQTVGQDTNGVGLEGTVLAVDATARTLTVSADDQDASGQSITVTVPDTFDISGFTTGDEVELTVQPTGAGTAMLLGSADDGNAQSANSGSDTQGDLGDNGAQTDDSSGAQSGSPTTTESSGETVTPGTGD